MSNNQSMMQKKLDCDFANGFFPSISFYFYL